jgi:hypothetical protein
MFATSKTLPAPLAQLQLLLGSWAGLTSHAVKCMKTGTLATAVTGSRYQPYHKLLSPLVLSPCNSQDQTTGLNNCRAASRDRYRFVQHCSRIRTSSKALPAQHAAGWCVHQSLPSTPSSPHQCQCPQPATHGRHTWSSGQLLFSSRPCRPPPPLLACSEVYAEHSSIHSTS